MASSRSCGNSMWLMLACASESITRSFLPWSFANVSASARTSVDLPTPPLAFITVMELRMGPLVSVARTTTHIARQERNEGDFVTVPWRLGVSAPAASHGEDDGKWQNDGDVRLKEACTGPQNLRHHNRPGGQPWPRHPPSKFHSNCGNSPNGTWSKRAPLMANLWTPWCRHLACGSGRCRRAK